MSIKRDYLPKRINSFGVEADSESLNIWRKMPNDQFIDDIDTNSAKEVEDDTNFNLLVSSIPSPWARVHMTSHAICRELVDGDTRMLMKIYEFIRSEWRGLVAAFVLYPDYFKLTEPIQLKAIDINEREGKFDIISTFSEMLFEDADLWKFEKGEQDIPKLQLLYYVNGTMKPELVGSTSPFTLFFTGLNYSIPQDDEHIYWVKKNGKLCDPLSMPIYYQKGESKYKDGKHFDNLKKLYSFLSSVQKNRDAYISELRGIWDSNPKHKDDELSATSDSRCNFVNTVLDKAISNWMKDLDVVLGSEEVAKAKNLPIQFTPPEGPLKTLLSVTNDYYWWNNTFNTSENIDSSVNAKVDVEKLFIDSNDLALLPDESRTVLNSQGEVADHKIMDYRRSPVYFLEVHENDQTWFVALPLSEYALNIFGEESSKIISGDGEKVRLWAEKNGDKVDVRLEARIDGKTEFNVVRSRTFNIKDCELDSHKYVFIWPNFCSKQWTRYYYYSEYPTNSPDVQMVPVFDVIGDEKPELQGNNDVFMRLVKSPDTVISGAHRYEIIRTNQPLKYIKIRKRVGSKMEDLGLLLIRQQDTKPSNTEPEAMYRITRKMGEATVGFDFGSTNSCSYYKNDIKNEQGENDIKAVPFDNHRLAIIGFDNEPRKTARPNELLFISNEKPINDNGQIKSWLHEHDEKYTKEEDMEQELVGGVPVNETNIVVKSMDAYEIITNAGKLDYNMKWLKGVDGKHRKQAFMKMVWIQICADLFEKGVYPKTLNWSYPSAMGTSDLEALSDIFAGLPNPSEFIIDKHWYTEAEAVCSYFLGKPISLTNKNLFLGIDIGGSTSDILIMGRDRGNNRPPTIQNPLLPDIPFYIVLGGRCDYKEYRGKDLLDMKNRGEFDEKTLVFNKQLMSDWKPAGQVKELQPLFIPSIPDLPPIPGIPPVPDIPPIPGAMPQPISNGTMPQETNNRRLYTQCSVRMAAGMFFDAIIKSKKFRDSIRRFNDSKKTKIDVVGIGSMEADPQRAPYYLNNIFDQLHGVEDFKKFYASLRSEVPFVFIIPAYITGALMAYAGMLIRNTILTQQLQDIKEIHWRYFGKGGRLFEWLFFSYNEDLVNDYLNTCFEVGLKKDQIDIAFGRTGDGIKCTFDLLEDIKSGRYDNSENKSEVAHGLVSVSQQSNPVAGIDRDRKMRFVKRKGNAPKEYDARKQEVIGEIGVTWNGRSVGELDIVDDNFYEYEGAVIMPEKFQNFNDFIEVFTQFVGRETSIYPNANKLLSRAQEVKNVNSYIINDQEYINYIKNIKNDQEDSFRMPVFIASALYYLKEVILKEVFKS